MVPLRAAELRAETLRAYGEYIGAVHRSFEEDVRTGRALFEVADSTPVMRDGHVLVQAARGSGIVAIPGGLIHHWRGMMFIPGATLEEAISVSQDYANYKHVYEPVLNAVVLEHDGDTFRVRMRVHKRSGPVSAVLDLWSVVRYDKTGSVVYSVSDSERITEVTNASKPNEHRLPPGQDSGYLWRASTFSRLAEREAGVLVEIENIGLSRRFPPLLGWIIEPIAQRVGRSGVEDSLVEYRAAVIAHAAQGPATINK